MPEETPVSTPAKRDTPLISLEDRGLMVLSGQDTRSFLQGLVTADLDLLVPGRALYSTLLTPQGKFLDDFFLVQPDAEDDNLLWLEASKKRLVPIARRLALYRLRADVKIAALEPVHHVYVSLARDPKELGTDLPPQAGLWCCDPRPSSAGDNAQNRATTPLAEKQPTDQESADQITAAPGTVDERKADLGPAILGPAILGPAILGAAILGSRYYSQQRLDGAPGTDSPAYQAYEQQRIRLGLPDGEQDVEREKSTLLDNGFDHAGAIAWQKGCYMGQEITARMRYRGLAKWDLLPVGLATGNFADFDLGHGEAVTLDGKPVGQLRSCSGNVALARLRLEALSEGLDRLMVHDQPLHLLGRLLGSAEQEATDPLRV